jgi:hypothetical protein
MPIGFFIQLAWKTAFPEIAGSPQRDTACLAKPAL